MSKVELPYFDLVNRVEDLEETMAFVKVLILKNNDEIEAILKAVEAEKAKQ